MYLVWDFLITVMLSQGQIAEIRLLHIALLHAQAITGLVICRSYVNLSDLFDVIWHKLWFQEMEANDINR